LEQVSVIRVAQRHIMFTPDIEDGRGSGKNNEGEDNNIG
jgi:hypothetical protein